MQYFADVVRGQANALRYVEKKSLHPLCAPLGQEAQYSVALPRGGRTAENWTVTRLWAHCIVLPAPEVCRGCGPIRPEPVRSHGTENLIGRLK